MHSRLAAVIRVDKPHHSTAPAAGSWLNIATHRAAAPARTYRQSVPRTGLLSSVHSYLIAMQSLVTRIGAGKA